MNRLARLAPGLTTNHVIAIVVTRRQNPRDDDGSAGTRTGP